MQKLAAQAPRAGKHIEALMSLSKRKPVRIAVGGSGGLPTARVRQLHVHGELGQQQAGRDWIKTQPDGKIHRAKAPITNDFGTSATVLSRSLQVPAPWNARLLKWQQTRLATR